MTLKTCLLTAFLLAHSWYPPACCNGSDCHAISCNEVTQDTAGYHWRGHTFTSAAPSQDSDCPACIYNGRATCLFLSMSS
jgi:hypothetical protein